MSADSEELSRSSVEIENLKMDALSEPEQKSLARLNELIQMAKEEKAKLQVAMVNQNCDVCVKLGSQGLSSFSSETNLKVSIGE